MELLGPLVYVLGVILAIAWIILPFAVFGVKKRIETLIEVQNRMLAFMEDSRARQMTVPSSNQPNNDDEIQTEPSAIPYNLRGKVREMMCDGSYSIAGIALATNLRESDIEGEVLRLHKSGVLLKQEAERILGQEIA